METFISGISKTGNSAIGFRGNALLEEAGKGSFHVKKLFHCTIEKTASGGISGTQNIETTYSIIEQGKISNITPMNIFLFTGFIVSAIFATKLFWENRRLQKENAEQKEAIDKVVKEKVSLEKKVDELASRVSLIEEDRRKRIKENEILQKKVDNEEFDGESRGYMEAHNYFSGKIEGLMKENKTLREEKNEQDDRIKALNRKLEELASEFMEMRKNGTGK